MTTRRTFITGLTGLGLGFGTGLTLSSCSSARQQPSTYSGDARTLALAAALENQLTAVYAEVLAALHKGGLGTVPPAFAALVDTARAHHSEHADAWNGLLRDAHQPALSGVPLANHAAVIDGISRATSVSALAKQVQGLENQAACTHLAALGTLSASADVSIAASIAPVEAMHAAVLGYLLGEDPAPDGLLDPAGAARPSALLA